MTTEPLARGTEGRLALEELREFSGLLLAAADEGLTGYSISEWMNAAPGRVPRVLRACESFAAAIRFFGGRG